MEFDIVYDLISVPSPLNFNDYWDRGIGALFFVIGFVYLLKSSEGVARRIFGFTIGVLGGSFIFFFAIPSEDGGPDRERLIAAYEQGDYQVVEGVVTSFHPMNWAGNGDRESFRVDGQHFEYSDFFITGGYRNTQPYGGQIREGKYVIIWHVDGVIVHLEIARDDT